MGILDTIISQVLSPQGNSPLVADLEKVATDALTNAEAANTGGQTTTPATTTTKPDMPPTDTTATDTPDTDTTNTDTTTPDTPPAKVDVAAMLDGLKDQSDEDLDWRKSIVDLLKLLGHDSSLSARKQLADELHYDGDTDDSASMNVWLHKEVMNKLAENGGKLPDDL